MVLRSQLCSAESLRSPALRVWAERLRPMWDGGDGDGDVGDGVGCRPARHHAPPQDVGVALRRRGAARTGGAGGRASWPRLRGGPGAADGVVRGRGLRRGRLGPAAPGGGGERLDGLVVGVGGRVGEPQSMGAVRRRRVRPPCALPGGGHEGHSPRPPHGCLRLHMVVVCPGAPGHPGGRGGLRRGADGLPEAGRRRRPHDGVPGVLERRDGRGRRDGVLPAP